MQIGFTGASGMIGLATIPKLIALGHTVVAFSRDPNRPLAGTKETRLLDLDTAPDVRGLDAIIHLAGDPILGIWTKAKKQRLRDSRIDLSRHLVAALRDSSEKPTALISASGVSYYGDGGDTLLTESSPQGNGFLADLAADWEAEVARASEFGIRTCSLRFGAVLSLEGGMLPLLRRVFNLCLGGRLSSGHQWMSWIHIDDVTSLLCAAVEDHSFTGPVNATAPHPVTNRDFTETLAEILHRPALFPVPAFALKLVMRGLSDVALQSQRCQPAAAEAHGFTFEFPELRPALQNLLAKT